MQPQAAAAAAAAGYQRSFVSQRHKSLLVELVQRDYDLLTNRSIYSRQERHYKWQEIADQLNALQSSCYKVPSGWTNYFSAMRDQVFLKQRRMDAKLLGASNMSALDKQIFEMCRASYDRLYAADRGVAQRQEDSGATTGGEEAVAMVARRDTRTSSTESAAPPSPSPDEDAAKRRRTEPLPPVIVSSRTASSPASPVANALEEFNDKMVYTLQNNELLREHNDLLRENNALLQESFREEREYRAEMLAMKRRQLDLIERQEERRLLQQQLQQKQQPPKQKQQPQQPQQPQRRLSGRVAEAAIVKQKPPQRPEEDGGGDGEDLREETTTRLVKDEPVDFEFILN